MKSKVVEIGAPICCSAKKCIIGDITKGTPTSVLVKTECPPGAKLTGIWHTHPQGDSYPSSFDVKSLRKANLQISCVSGKQGVKCYHITKKVTPLSTTNE